MTTQTVSAPGIASIPPKYEKLGVRHGWDPTDLSRLKVLLTALPAHGKTSFVMSHPNAWVMDPENMAGDVLRPKAHRIYLPSMAKYEELFKELIADGRAGKHPCKTIVFDTIDKFVEIAIIHLTIEWNKSSRPIRSILEAGQKGYGWGLVQDYLFSFIRDIYDAGYGWIIVGHLKLSNPVHMVMPPAFQGYILKEAQYWGHLTRTTTSKVEEVGIKYFETSSGKKVPSPIKETVLTQHVTLSFQDLNPDPEKKRELKARYLEFLPPSIDIPQHDGWSAFASMYNSAIKQARESLTSDERKPE